MKSRLTHLTRNLRKNATDAERKLWQKLRNRQIGGVKFRRQQPMGSYIVDFISFEKRLIIEVDGGQHVKQAGFDKQRDFWFEQQGYQVLRFWNHEVMLHIDDVLRRIEEYCQ